MKKVVLKLDLQDDRAKQKAIKMVSSLQGVDKIEVDMHEKKMTIVGYIDEVQVVSNLRKTWLTDILSVGPAKETQEEDDEGKTDDNNQRDPNEQFAELVKAYNQYNPYIPTC